MKLLIQRVSHASVAVDSQTIGSIQQGLLLFIGIEKHDDETLLKRMAEKALAYRIFNDSDGKMNLSVKDVQGGILAISQFTLAAQTKKGLRPGFSGAAPPADAEKLYLQFTELLRQRHQPVECGSFGADMKVSLLNDGPVTFMLEM